MLDIRGIYSIQSNFNVGDKSYRSAEVTLEEYVSQCRIYLSRNLPKEYTKGNWDAKKKQGTLESMTAEFVDKHKVKVRGYTSKEGVVDADLLLIDVSNSITGVSVIKEALEDEEVDEIQIKDKNTINVVRSGRVFPFVDRHGRVMQFDNNDDIMILVNKLIDDGSGSIPQFTDGKPLLNAKTAKNQYRLNATHPVTNAICKPPFNFPITTVTIRKFREVTLTVDDLVSGGSMSPKMGRLAKLLGRVNLRLFCVGPTSSGKTTLLKIIAEGIPLDKCIILIQNPTEISFYERDEHGRLIRNVAHHEVYSGNLSDKNAASMANLISNAMRESPDVIIPGEAREPDEFYQIFRAGRTGHGVMSSFHANGAEDGVVRCAQELASVTGSPFKDCVGIVASGMDFVIGQFKFASGDRRILEMTEVLGVDEDNKPVINKLFEFRYSGKVNDVDGKKVVDGKFCQVGRLSSKLQTAFFQSSIGMEEIEEFVNPVGDDVFLDN